MLRFLWRASRGHRLTPWNSPYLRWRIETYWGLHAENITPAEFRQFVWTHRSELWRFLRWARQMNRSMYGGPPGPQPASRPAVRITQPSR